MIEKLNGDDAIKKYLESVINKSAYMWKGIIPAKYTKVDFLNSTPPTENIETDNQRGVFFNIPRHFIEQEIVAVENLIGGECTNHIVYPPMSIMKWHTNSNNPGLRTYYTYGVKESIFRYIDKNGNIIDDYDNKGWTVRRFKVDQENLLWHTIWSEGTRFAFGFNETTNLS